MFLLKFEIKLLKLIIIKNIISLAAWRNTDCLVRIFSLNKFMDISHGNLLWHFSLSLPLFKDLFALYWKQGKWMSRLQSQFQSSTRFTCFVKKERGFCLLLSISKKLLQNVAVAYWQNGKTFIYYICRWKKK